MPKIIHFPQRCIGCLACTSIAPEHFEVDSETGKSRLIDGQADGETFCKQVESVPELLVETCPAQAIEVQPDKDKQQPADSKPNKSN